MAAGEFWLHSNGSEHFFRYRDSSNRVRQVNTIGVMVSLATLNKMVERELAIVLPFDGYHAVPATKIGSNVYGLYWNTKLTKTQLGLPEGSIWVQGNQLCWAGKWGGTTGTVLSIEATGALV